MCQIKLFLLFHSNFTDSNCQEIIEDIYEKYSQEDGVIPFKAVKWIIIGPPQVGKTTTKMHLLDQIGNIESEGGDVRPDSAGIEKPLEIMSATMIQDKSDRIKIVYNRMLWMSLNWAGFQCVTLIHINRLLVNSCL